jgi:hypothetical protein
MPPSPRVSIVETPAGFELNSEQVAGHVAKFLQAHLKNYQPQTRLIPARKKGTDFSPDHPEIAEPILESDLIFMGPGSPTYAVRQLEKSLAWEYLLACHRLGGGLALSSATTVAISASALPVYEIYKVGQDLHWQPGLDFFAAYQLSLVFIPHWNNKDGGKELDTSRCYMGKSRFDSLLKMLPKDQIVIGIDEHTGLILDFSDCCFHVIGSGNVTVLAHDSEIVHPTGSSVELEELGNFILPDPQEGISPASWQSALDFQERLSQKILPPQEVVNLADKRQQARQEKDWQAADDLRREIEKEGWIIDDNPEGYKLKKK